MKRVLAFLLCLTFALTGCAQTLPAPDGGEQDDPVQSEDGESAKLLNQYTLAAAELPVLPAQPSEEELYAAYEKLDYDRMGEEALRGEGVDASMTPALLGYSTKTVSKLLGGEETENVVYSPANLYLALSMLTTALVTPRLLASFATSSSAIKQCARQPSFFSAVLLMPANAILVSVTISTPDFSSFFAVKTASSEYIMVFA